VPPAIEIATAAAMVKEIFFTAILLGGFVIQEIDLLLRCGMRSVASQQCRIAMRGFAQRFVSPRAQGIELNG
jgi:hypothetical protein